MTDDRSLADILRAHRTERLLTIEALAELSAVSDRTISDIERGVSRTPHQRTLLALAAALDLDDEATVALSHAARRPALRPAFPQRGISIAPASDADFTGRDREIDAVIEMLRSDAAGPHVVIISGSPGIGKTATAVEMTRRLAFAGTVLFADLAGLEHLPLTPLQSFQSLLQQAAEQPASRSLDAAATAWRRCSGRERTLVVLDNAANESQVRPILDASAPGTIVIVTSRRSLSGILGAVRIPLTTMSREESISLLQRIIPPAQRTSAELVDLAGLCDGVPLALRVAGNRVASRPTWTATDLIERMRSEERRLPALRAGDLAVGAAFASSYEQLSADLRDLYRSLPLIEGTTFDRWQVAALLDATPDATEDLLDELTELGLLEERGSARYRLHSLARLYAAGRMREELSADDIRTRRARLRSWLLSTAMRAGVRFEPDPAAAGAPTIGPALGDPGSARAWLEVEADAWFAAYREAAALGDRESVIRLADSLHWFSDLWTTWGHWRELFGMSAAAAAGDGVHEATHLGYLAWADIVESGDAAAGAHDAARAVAAADRAGDARQAGWARFYLAWAEDILGQPAQAIAHAESAIGRFEDAGDREGVLQATALIAAAYKTHYGPERSIGAHLRLLDDLERNAADLPENIALFTRHSAEQFLARAYLEAGLPSEALVHARSSGATAEQVGYAHGVMFNLLTIAQAEAAAGDLAEAERALAEAERMFEAEGIVPPARHADAVEAIARRRADALSGAVGARPLRAD